MIIGADISDGAVAAPKKINVEIEPAPGPALQTYVGEPSYPAGERARAKMVARPVGTEPKMP